MLMNMGPMHPSTHGVLSMMTMMYGEMMQWLSVELGLLHSGSEKLMDYNYYNNSMNYFDSLDYVSTMMQELLYVGVLEMFIQSNTYLFTLNFSMMFMEMFRMLNHYLALTTHMMDMGLFTCFLWGFEESEKLINYMESMSGSSLHNALLAVNNMGVDMEKPSLNMMVMLVLWLVMKYKELSYMLSTMSLFMSSLYHMGIMSGLYMVYGGMSGVMLSASNMYYDGSLYNEGMMGNMEYNMNMTRNSDCLDSFMMSMNESLNSVYMIYCLMLEMYLDYDMMMMSKSMMQSMISFSLVYGGMMYMYVMGVMNNSWIKYYLESSKGMYSMMMCWMGGLWMMGMMLNDYMVMNVVNSFCSVYNMGDMMAVLGSVDFVLGSVDG